MRLRHLLAIASLLSGPAVQAQAGSARVDTTYTLVGRVTDASDSAAIGLALVDIEDARVSIRANGLGRFRITGVPRSARALLVRSLGYEPLTITLPPTGRGTIDLGDLVLARKPQMLSQMVVDGKSLRVPRGFESVYTRGMSGRGRFVYREQIDSLQPTQLKALMHGIPGVWENDRGVYFQRCGNAGRSPEMYVDGTRVTRFMNDSRTDPNFMNFFLTTIRPTQVQAVEIYTSQSTVPAEFSMNEPCAVVAVWTRRS